jgi:hypothetical protein
MPDDIMSLVFRVMEQAVADTDADLRQMMDEMRKRREAIERMRRVVAEMAALGEASALGESELGKSLRNYVAGNLQSLADMSQTMELRLQMLMERRSKMLEMLSNLLKKQSDTASAIIANMK